MERGKQCIYRKLDNGIREFVFTQSSNAAVDEMIAHLNWIVLHDPTPAGVVGRTLMDTRQSGALPMYYTFKSITDWSRSAPLNERNRPTRTAQLYSANSVYVKISKGMMRMLPDEGRMKQEYFLNDRDSAIAWLLANE